MNKKQKLLVLICSVLFVTILGCSAWQDGLTPAYIDPDAIEYSETEPLVFTPYTSLWDLKRIKRAVNQKHILNQEELKWAAKGDVLAYNYLTEGLNISEISAAELRDNLFSPTGPIGMLLASAPAFGLGALLIKRPGDTPKGTV